MMRMLLWLMSLLLFQHLTAQEKIEIERRVRRGKVPEEAVKWVDTVYGSVGRVKWYYEENGGKESYEAKLFFKGQNHSVEFNKRGKPEDVEIAVSWQELPEELRKGLTGYFEENYSRFTVRKIQRQLPGKEEHEKLVRAIREKEVSDLEVRYEIEFYGKTDTDTEIWEGLFDAEGKLIRKDKIKYTVTNNLNY